MKEFIGCVFALCLLIAACSGPPEPTYKVSDYKVDTKYCVDACMHDQFGMFHNNGSSWGTGSSSMNGLGQSKIYDRVKQECVEFYKNETCCQRPANDYHNHVIQSRIHGYEYGACKK